MGPANARSELNFKLSSHGIAELTRAERRLSAPSSFDFFARALPNLTLTERPCGSVLRPARSSVLATGSAQEQTHSLQRVWKLCREYRRLSATRFYRCSWSSDLEEISF